MNPSGKDIDDPQEIKATDAQASLFMEEGIRLLQSKNDADAAILYFDCALELRRRLPIGMPMHAYGLAACWLNRAEALTRLGPTEHAQTLQAYDEALALLRSLPLADDVRFSKRLAIAHQNRALVLAAQKPPATMEAITSLHDAVAALDHAGAMDATERDHLLAVVWMNLANIQSLEDTLPSNLDAREAARRTLALVKAYEHQDVAAAEAGLKARHVLCRIAARRLSAHPENEVDIADVHDATDLADEGLDLVREWEQGGVDRFRGLASDLFRFGVRVYAYYQPHFLDQFISEQLDPERFGPPYLQSTEMQDAARDIILLLTSLRPEGRE